MKKRKLFCEICPFCYQLSVCKCKIMRCLRDAVSSARFARTKESKPLGTLIYSHKSLIRRKLGAVDPVLQENKAVNLALAAPKISGVLIRPGETFSFWRLVGLTSAQKGYRVGLMIKHGTPDHGIGGGLCQMTNLIHWLILHSPLQIIEHHHHDGMDIFPDFGRQVPFGVGTSISHNYLDYRFVNNGKQSFQIVLYCTDEYLCGELRAECPLDVKYHISVQNEGFSEENGMWFRNNQIFRKTVEKATGKILEEELIKTNHARVMYDPEFIPEDKRVKNQRPNS